MTDWNWKFLIVKVLVTVKILFANFANKIGKFFDWIQFSVNLLIKMENVYHRNYYISFFFFNYTRIICNSTHKHLQLLIYFNVSGSLSCEEIFRNGIMYLKKVWRLIPSSEMEFYAEKKLFTRRLKGFCCPFSFGITRERFITNFYYLTIARLIKNIILDWIN